jgi:periplasmic divalent cation tolerance protein
MNAPNRRQTAEMKDKKMESYIQVITTTEKKEDAEKMAMTLIERKLAACVQIVGPIVSTYRWKGTIETAMEWQCVIKSREGLYEEIEKSIKAVHPYDVPEIMVVPIIGGSSDYLEWLRGEVV